jgi:hypothetical protein
VDHAIECGRHALVHLERVIPLDYIRGVAVAAEEGVQLFAGNTGKYSRAGNLVLVQVQDGQHHAVVDRVEELVGVPAGGKGAGLRFAIADDACHDQVWIVERRTERVRQRVSQFTAFVDRTRRLWSNVTRDAAGERELRE